MRAGWDGINFTILYKLQTRLVFEASACNDCVLTG